MSFLHVIPYPEFVNTTVASLMYPAVAPVIGASGDFNIFQNVKLLPCVVLHHKANEKSREMDTR